MIYALLVPMLILAGLLSYTLYREPARVDALLSAHRAETKALVDQIVLLKVDPPMAAIQAIPESSLEQTHLSLADDSSVAEYEQERSRIVGDTRAFIEQHELAGAE